MVTVNPMDGTCALCHQHRVLQKSHFLPKAIYRLLRGEKGPDLHPAIISGTSVWQSSSQATAYLLCVDCEQRFHANGEDWTLRNCYRAEQGFRLREILFRANPVYAEDNVLTEGLLKNGTDWNNYEWMFLTAHFA